MIRGDGESKHRGLSHKGKVRVKAKLSSKMGIGLKHILIMVIFFSIQSQIEESFGEVSVLFCI